MYTNTSLNTILRKNKKKELINEGSSRKVYDLKDGYVLKAAKNKKGIIENYNENYIYNHSIAEIKEYLCPVIQYEEKYLIMPKIEVISNEDFTLEEIDEIVINKHLHVIEYLTKRFNSDDFDLKFGFNWGFYNSKIVILDYGHQYFGTYVDE